MKQAILTEPGKIEIRDVTLPDPAEGELIIKVEAALTCGTDLKAWVRGHDLIPMPGPFGHEYSGTVIRTGRGVSRFREGDNVMGVHSAPCLECDYCGKGLYNLCTMIMKSKTLGAFAEQMLIPAHVVEQNLFIKPGGLSFEKAALLEPFSCVVHPYRSLEHAGIETALVIGAGPIGLMHLAYLKMKGVAVAVADLSPERRSKAVEVGADRVCEGETIGEVIRELTGGMGADLVVECTGRKNVWEDSVRYVRRGGTVLLFGGCPGGTAVTFDAHRLHYDEITLAGSFHYTPEDVKTAHEIITAGTIDLDPLISGEFPLDEIETAFGMLREGRGVKYVISEKGEKGGKGVGSRQ
jgi:L-iditol 2-dehydrogenase